MAAGRVTFTPDPPAMRRFLLSSNGPVSQELMRRGRRVQNRAKVLCPVDQGTLRNSIYLELDTRGGMLIAVIGSRLGYAIFVHNGTGLYGSGALIRPVRAQALAWPNRSGAGRGPVSFAMWSTGTPGRPFLVDALPEAAVA